MLRYDQKKFNRLALIGMGFAFALLAISVVIVIYGSRASEDSNERVDHSYQIKDKVGLFESMIERAEAARRGYLINPQPLRMQTYENSVAVLEPTLSKIREMTLDNRSQQLRLDQLEPMVKGHIADLDRSLAIAKTGDVVAAREQFSLEFDQLTIRKIRSLTAAISAEESRLLARRLEEQHASQHFVWISLGVTAALLLCVAIASMILVRRFTTDLYNSRERLNQLNSNLEGAVRVRTADLQRANDEIQRFAYIVSHDLRSPLVNIMGFTAELERADKTVEQFIDDVEKHQPDLITPDVRYATREDLPEAIGFIRSSTQKMDRLINAILDLSRQGRRVLTPEHLPMERVLGDIAGSLTALAEERGATIRVETPLPDLSHDRVAIEQIFTNLMENATKYLRPGVAGEIVVRGRREGKRAIYEVEDNGRGIAPEDHERVFELFRRSGQQDQRGEGIGLANVRALAYRLGGTVTVRSILSEGSTFIVDLPTEFQGE